MSEPTINRTVYVREDEFGIHIANPKRSPLTQTVMEANLTPIYVDLFKEFFIDPWEVEVIVEPEPDMFEIPNFERKTALALPDYGIMIIEPKRSHRRRPWWRRMWKRSK